MTSKSNLLLTVLLSIASSLFAAMPQVDSIQPQGGTRGQEVELHLRGVRLAEPRQLLWHASGIETVSLRNEGEKQNHVIAELRIAPDCALGPHPFRLYTRSGLSGLRLFFVGPYPQVEEVEPNNALDVAQEIPVGTTVEGIILNEDVDCFRFQAARGERISLEMEAVRLGRFLLDGHLAVLDTNRFEIAASDDSNQFLQDPLVSFIAPYDGAYFVQARESSYGGNDKSRYRLHLGNHPRPAAVYPPGGKPGETRSLTFLGDPMGPFTNSIVLTGDGMSRVPAAHQGLECPSAVPVRVMPMDVCEEVEPNQNRKQLDTNSVPSVPLALHGIVGAEKDEDWFAFRAAKGAHHVKVFARRLGTPLDPVINLFDASGKHLKGNDDSQGMMDSYIRWAAPTDGQYFAKVHDHLRGGSPYSVYRVEITRVAPALSLNFVEFKRRTQQRQHIVVPRGNRTAALLGVKREDFSGDVELEMPELPPGVTASVFPVAGDLDRIPVIFHATTNAPMKATLLDIQAHRSGDAKGVRGHLKEDVELVYGPPNNALYFSARIERAALAVARPQEFRVVLEPPSVPIVQGGTLYLNVRIERNEGFDKKIRVRMVANPPGITSPGEVAIEPGSSTARYRLNASGAAGNTTRKIAVIAAVAGAEEATWVASEAVDLTTVSPFVSGGLDMTVVEQGAEGEGMFCNINFHRTFDGDASIRLVGLPHGVTSKEQVFTNGAGAVRFPLTVAADAARGQHKNLFCHVEIPVSGGTVSQSLASGGTLRVDAPKPERKAPAVVAKAAPAAAPKPEKRLSRLEQLRLRQKKGASQ